MEQMQPKIPNLKFFTVTQSAKYIFVIIIINTLSSFISLETDQQMQSIGIFLLFLRISNV